jgi:Uma2 family endonuclease
VSLPAVEYPKGISYEEFLATVDESTHAEWVDGEVVLMTPPSDEHARISLFLAAVIEGWIELSGAGGTVRHAPYEMKLPITARQPDVLWAGPDKDARVTRRGLQGAADLVIEVVSPESRTRDRREKFIEYAQVGVREYWLVDPMRSTCEVYRLQKDGVYELFQDGSGSRVESSVLSGFWIDPAWMWEAKPRIFTAFRAWKRVE